MPAFDDSFLGGRSHFTVFEDFRERMETLYLYRPLLDLHRSQSFEEYDLVFLGLSILLFILENMLRSPGEPCGHAEIRRFLRRTMEQTYGDDPGDDTAGAVEEYLLERLRNHGRRFSYPYTDPTSGKTENVTFDLITVDDYEHRDRWVGFKLTEHGLELIFRTREMSRELRVGIYQIYLRQQLERGTFDGALEALDTLTMEVRSQLERLRALEYRIYHSLRSVRTEEYRRQYERTREVLEAEQLQFQHLKALIESERLSRESIVAPTDTDLRALGQLKRIEIELHRVSNEHSQLLARRMEVDNLFMQELWAELQKGFRIRFRLEDELLDPLLLLPDSPADRVRTAVESLLPPLIPRYFNPLRSMHRQVLWGASEEKSEEIELVSEGETDDMQGILQSQRRCIGYLKLLVSLALGGRTFTLHELMSAQPDDERRSMSRCRDFFQLMMNLHQEGELDIRGILEHRDEWLDSGDMPLPYLVSRALEDFEELPPSLKVTADHETLFLPNGNYISNLVFQPVEGDDSID